MRAIVAKLAGWGRFPVQECRVFRPEKQAELKAIFSSGDRTSFIPRGLGRSYGDAALNEGGAVINQLRLNRFLSFDSQSGIVECETGVTFEDLIACFLPRGWFPPVTPGTKFVTLGGAVAADIHGKNHHRNGTIASWIDRLTLLTPKGDLWELSPNENSEIFWATVGGMGLTGVITRVRLRLRRVESGYFLVDFQKVRNLDEALEQFSTTDEHYQYSVGWIDCLTRGRSMGRAVLMRGTHASASDLPRGLGNPLQVPARFRWNLPFDLPSFALSSWGVAAFNSLYFRLRRPQVREIVDFETFLYPLDFIRNWNRLYGRRGFVQYQVAFPLENGYAGMRTLLECISRSEHASFLAVIKQFGKANSGLLSFPFLGYTLAVDLPMSRDLGAFLHDLDRLVVHHGGRVYLAKDAVLSARTFAEMYPKLEQFRAIKARLDPQGLLSSSLARRLNIMPR